MGGSWWRHRDRSVGILIKKLSEIKVRSEIWITIQVVLLAVLIFAQFPVDYTVTPFLGLMAHIFEGAAVIVGIVAIYNLRHSLSITPHPVEKGQFEAKGIYRYIRHPMYTAVFLVSIGIALNSGSYWKFAVVAALVIFFRIKTEYEEGLLVKRYPGYKDYIKNTGRYFPMFLSNR